MPSLEARQRYDALGGCTDSRGGTAPGAAHSPIPCLSPPTPPCNHMPATVQAEGKLTSTNLELSASNPTASSKLTTSGQAAGKDGTNLQSNGFVTLAPDSATAIGEHARGAGRLTLARQHCVTQQLTALSVCAQPVGGLPGALHAKSLHASVLESSATRPRACCLTDFLICMRSLAVQVSPRAPPRARMPSWPPTLKPSPRQRSTAQPRRSQRRSALGQRVRKCQQGTAQQ